ncbi:MAG: hypothetical protein LC795_15480 [Acidobacteria bacterium]|nr:hypothetical protein [Acidobacteriota bacterium]MCA1620677.1 hypothetical protein [Acidobacteriota bacterium]
MLSTHDANRAAARGHSAGLARALKRLGMRRCSERLVRYQYEPGAARPSYYCLYWRWLQALFVANRAGFDFLFEDLCARVAELRGAAAPARGYFEQVAVCAREHGEALAAAAERRDRDAIRRELTESIAAERELLSMLDRPAHGVARHAA